MDQSKVEFLDRPSDQPVYVPQSYVRPAPGVFIERIETDIAPYVTEVASRWRGVDVNKMHRIAA